MSGKVGMFIVGDLPVFGMDGVTVGVGTTGGGRLPWLSSTRLLTSGLPSLMSAVR
jgi:hypothetical protein